MPISPILTVFFLALCSMLPGSLLAGESDQFANRLVPLTDATSIIEGKINNTIQDIANGWRGKRDELKFARKLKGQLMFGWVIHTGELWIEFNPEIQKLNRPYGDIVYDQVPKGKKYDVKFFGSYSTISVCNQRIGIDKLGHFISLGYHLFTGTYGGKRSYDGQLAHSVDTEWGVFGMGNTGILSNADLIANVEGMGFYYSLFYDGIHGRNAVIQWKGNVPVVTRKIVLSDFINEYWDEVLNPSKFSTSMTKVLYPIQKNFCKDFETNPSAFEMSEERRAALENRYSEVHLVREGTKNIREVCNDDSIEALPIDKKKIQEILEGKRS